MINNQAKGPKNLKEAKQVLWTLYGALIFSRFLFLFLGVQFIYSPNILRADFLKSEYVISLGLIVGAVAMALTKLSYNKNTIYKGVTLEPGKPLTLEQQFKVIQNFTTASILGLILSESVAIIGLVSLQLGLDLQTFSMMIGLSVLIGAMQFPRFEKLKL